MRRVMGLGAAAKSVIKPAADACVQHLFKHLAVMPCRVNRTPTYPPAHGTRYLEVAPAAGWAPAWRGPCIAAVVVGSVAISLLVLWLLVSKEQHTRLLKAMLPDQVLAQLQDGEGTVAEEYKDVTVLCSDMASTE